MPLKGGFVATVIVVVMVMMVLVAASLPTKMLLVLMLRLIVVLLRRVTTSKMKLTMVRKGPGFLAGLIRCSSKVMNRQDRVSRRFVVEWAPMMQVEERQR